MRSIEKLEYVDATNLKQSVLAAVSQYGGNFKTWHAAASKIPDFPASRTLQLWMEKNGRHEARRVAAVRFATRLSPTELDAGIFETHADRVLAGNELYAKINQLIVEIGGSNSNARLIELCAMQGTDEPRIVREPDPPPEFSHFVKLMTDCILDPKWKVDILYNVPSKARFQQIMRRLNQAKNAENHEVRAYGIEGSIPAFCPMIVGTRDAFVAMSHPRYYRAESALYIRGTDKVAFMERYWKTLWSPARIIRSEAGIKWGELRKLEQELKTRT